MNQDQVKENLLKVRFDVPDFAVLFSGKTSRKIDGLYHPEKEEIIIHNKNFTDDNSLMYTALHEFAHHIQFQNGDPGRNQHGKDFWSIFHGLLNDAEAASVYEDVTKTDPRFQEITESIRKDYISFGGQLMKNFGKMMIQALDLCQQNHVVFEDYVDRALQMSRTEAKKVMKVYALDVNPEIGYENMKVVSGVKDPGKRREMEELFIAGSSRDQVRHEFANEDRSSGYDLRKLVSQKKRLEKSIQAMQQKLAYIEAEIEGAES